MSLKRLPRSRSDHCIDALITSAELKHISGVELCWEARLLATCRRPIYVLMMSSRKYDQRSLIEALDSGADDFIGKPPLAEELFARLRAAERILSMQHELIRLATIDPLTGLCNRRGFFEHRQGGRCHLNGLAMEDGVPRYVTAVSKSDTIDGWRDRRFDGGIVIDVQSGEIVAGGLSMPHSPRLYRGKLWILNSGTGEIGWIEPGGRRMTPPSTCSPSAPASCAGSPSTANMPSSGCRSRAIERFEGLALDKKLTETDSEPWCGVQVIDLDSGACVHWFRIDGPVGELYDLGVVPGVVRPMALGFATNEILGLITHDPLTSNRPRVRFEQLLCAGLACLGFFRLLVRAAA